MAIIAHDSTEVIAYPDGHDAHDEVYYTFVYKPQTRQNNKEYLLDDIVILSSATGYYFICIVPGISAGIPPTFTTSPKGITEDGTVKWKALPYNFKMKFTDVFKEDDPDVPASAWELSTGISITDSGYGDGITWAKVKITDATIKSFILTNHINVVHNDSRTEIFDRSIEVQVVPL